MAKTYNDALEWAAQWIEDTLRNGPETNERTVEFGTNMAMTLRAAKLPDADLPRAAADVLGIINGYIDECGQTAENAAGGDKLRLGYLRATANEILRRIIATPHFETGLTVEAALKELRELTPHCCNVSFLTTGGVAITVYANSIVPLELLRTERASLDEAMDQVRAWAKSRAEREGERT